MYDALYPTVLGELSAMRAIHWERMSIPPPFHFWSLVRRLNPDVVVVSQPEFCVRVAVGGHGENGRCKCHLLHANTYASPAQMVGDIDAIVSRLGCQG